MTRVIDFVNAYLKMDLRPIPLYHGSKRPIGKGWNEDWSRDRCVDIFDEYPNANVGLLLGPIVDVEGDTPEANQVLRSMLEDYPHPRWSSAKSEHHLFLTPDARLTRRVHDGIEFRGTRHQSVVPPSIHPETKNRYKWLEKPYPIPEFPLSLLEYFKSIPGKFEKKREEGVVVFSVNHKSGRNAAEQYYGKHLKWKYDKKPGHAKIWCSQCRELCYLHKNRLKLELWAFKDMDLPWSCRTCRDVDVRDKCRELRKKVR
jgi:hypothetical protein